MLTSFKLLTRATLNKDYSKTIYSYLTKQIVIVHKVE